MFRILISLCIIQATLGKPNDNGSAPWPEERILGGNDAEIGNFPYQASLQENGVHVCGGVIISDTYISTAASCVYSKLPGIFRIVAGSTTLSPLGPHGQVRNVEAIDIHTNYDESSPDYNIAMLKLTKPLKETDYVKPIAIATDAPHHGAIVTASGWGFTNSGSTPPNVLQAVTLKVLTELECILSYPLLYTDRLLCAFSLGKGIYNGDYGGPLTLNGILVGFSSFKQGGVSAFGIASEYQSFYDQYV